MGDLFWILVSAMVVNNFTLTLFLGLCPFMGVSAKIYTAIRMGAANIFVLILTSIAAWFLNNYVLPYAPYLRLISFIVVIASLVQIVEMIIKKISPVLFRQLGIFLPLITTNCAILGLAIFQTNRGYSFIEGFVFCFVYPHIVNVQVHVLDQLMITAVYLIIQFIQCVSNRILPARSCFCHIILKRIGWPEIVALLNSARRRPIACIAVIFFTLFNFVSWMAS